jgi:hypothetical protein
MGEEQEGRAKKQIKGLRPLNTSVARFCLFLEDKETSAQRPPQPCNE